MVIAIDGPAASGKSTVARRVAAALGRLYVDSGSLYRGVTWDVLRKRNGDGNTAVGASTEFEFNVKDGAVRFAIGGVDPGIELRSSAVDENVSRVAADPAVRKLVVGCLRGMEKLGHLVMEGRDIGTAVFPDADMKFYLDASAEERARRRHAEVVERGSGLSVENVGSSIRKRDEKDSGRKTDPLRVAEDAVVIDTTAMTIDEVVVAILERVRRSAGQASDS